MGPKRESRGKGKRERRVVSTNCPVLAKFLVTEDGDSLYLDEFITEHNHSPTRITADDFVNDNASDQESDEQKYGSNSTSEEHSQRIPQVRLFEKSLNSSVTLDETSINDSSEDDYEDENQNALDEAALKKVANVPKDEEANETDSSIGSKVSLEVGRSANMNTHENKRKCLLNSTQKSNSLKEVGTHDSSENDHQNGKRNVIDEVVREKITEASENEEKEKINFGINGEASLKGAPPSNVKMATNFSSKADCVDENQNAIDEAVLKNVEGLENEARIEADFEINGGNLEVARSYNVNDDESEKKCSSSRTKIFSTIEYLKNNLCTAKENSYNGSHPLKEDEIPKSEHIHLANESSSDNSKGEQFAGLDFMGGINDSLIDEYLTVNMTINDDTLLPISILDISQPQVLLNPPGIMTLNRHQVPISDLKFDLVRKSRGRPKGSQLKAIGIPKKQVPLSFEEKNLMQKKMQILEWIVDENVINAIRNEHYKLVAEDLPENIPDSFMDRSVNLSIIHEFCSGKVFKLLIEMVEQKKRDDSNLCKICMKKISNYDDRRRCDSCLLCYHFTCIIDKKYTKSSAVKKKWYCPNCDPNALEKKS